MFCQVGQAGLELRTSGDPPTSASQSAGIFFIFVNPVSPCVIQAGQGLPDSSDPFTLASQSAGITGASHHTGELQSFNKFK